MFRRITFLMIGLMSYTNEVHCGSFTLMVSATSNQTHRKEYCVLKLSAKYFVDKKALRGSIVIISINSRASNNQDFLLSIINNGMKYSVMVKDSSYPHANASHFPEKAKNYMFIIHDKLELNRNVQQLNKLPTWNPRAKATVYYEINKEEEGSEVAIGFINELRTFKLLRVIVLIYSAENNEVISYTWQPYSEINCGHICDKVHILDRCRENSVIQYKKETEIVISDMKRCPLLVFAVVSEPYVMPPNSKSNTTVDGEIYEFDRGAEIKLVKIIAQFMNMTPIFRTWLLSEQLGTITQHGDATGAFALLKNDSVDLLIGNVEATRTVRRWFDPTVSYTQDEMTWCVPIAGPASTWNNFVTIFQWPIWTVTFVMLVGKGLLFHYFFNKENINADRRIIKWPTNSLLMTYSMLLGWGAAFNPKGVTFRLLITTWLLFSLNLAISYSSFLRSFLMHPRFEKQISTEVELIESKISFGGREMYRNHFLDNDDISSSYFYENYKSVTFVEGVKRAAYERNMAVVVSRRQAMYQDQILGNGTRLLYCFSESNNLYKYGVVLLARKWHPMVENFNRIIRSMSENGLITKWTEEFVMNSRRDKISATEPLGTQHLLGAFLLISVMYGISIFIFLGEIIWKAIEVRNNNYSS